MDHPNKVSPETAVQRWLGWLLRSHWPSFTFLFALNFAVRYQELAKIPNRYLIPTKAWELSSIAISLVETGEFANPYMMATGPTAHLPPIFPYLFSLIYRWFGLTETAGLASLIFIITNGAVLYASLPWVADRLGLGRPAGFLGGLIGAFFVEIPGHGEFLTGLVMSLILVAFLHRWRKTAISRMSSLSFGIAIGAAFHLNPALLPVILGCLLFEGWWTRRPGKRTSLVILVLGILLACVPWGWRNYRAFDAIFFIRSNLGLELRMGNHDGAFATMEVMDAEAEHRHPSSHFTETRLLREIGEIAYMRQAGREAVDWILAHSDEFLKLTVQRFANLWLGPLHRPRAALGVSAITLLALWGAWRAFPALAAPQKAVLLIPPATFPLIYYVVAYMPRYRIPIDWVIFILAGKGLIFLFVGAMTQDPPMLFNSEHHGSQEPG